VVDPLLGIFQKWRHHPILMAILFIRRIMREEEEEEEGGKGPNLALSMIEGKRGG